jgi:hypothetical protein
VAAGGDEEEMVEEGEMGRWEDAQDEADAAAVVAAAAEEEQ